MARYDYSAVNSPQIDELAQLCSREFPIDTALYTQFDVKRGLRDLNGKGVLAGLTHIGNVCASRMENGVSVPCDGKLYYRGYDVEELCAGFLKEGRQGFEETVYLLLFGNLPTPAELADFTKLLSDLRYLPSVFTRDVIMKSPSDNMMNTLSKCVLSLYSYDTAADDISISNVLRQCLSLISVFPMISVYGYQAFNFKAGEDLILHHPRPELSLAENLLYMLRADGSFTALEAQLLDLALVLHAEHGGGNNSTFTVHVVSSSGTDTYSAMAAALGSLKGPRHGGANIKVCQMFDDLMEQVSDWEDEDALRRYLTALLHKEAFDRKGLIYGMGHAVYSVSDPRARTFKGFVQKLSVEKGREKEFALYERVERLASEVIAAERKIYKGVCANVDFYSGFVYRMLGLPVELFTPIFAVARIAGWSAHRIEELVNANKIIRPAYKAITEIRPYENLNNRV